MVRWEILPQARRLAVENRFYTLFQYTPGGIYCRATSLSLLVSSLSDVEIRICEIDLRSQRASQLPLDGTDQIMSRGQGG